jgi:ubiquinone/menaquinone biosynthesis C-methylase UbiE
MNPREYETMRRMEDDYWWYRGLHSMVVRIAGQKLAGLSAPAVLDAGCGTGGMLAALRRSLQGAWLTGLDCNARAIELTCARGLGAELVGGRVEAMPFPDDHFDLLVSLDVLYTKGLDDTRALHEFRRVLKTGKSLILNLPAFDLLKGAHDAAVHGGRRYTRRSLCQMLNRTGFEIEWLTYWNTILFPPITLWRVISRPRGRRLDPRSDLHPLPRLLNRFLETQIALEWWLARRIRLPFGTSVFAVARKLP